MVAQMMLNLMDEYTDISKEERFSKLESTRDQIEFILTKVRPLAHFRRQVYRRVYSFIAKHAKSSEKSQHFLTVGLNYSSIGNYLCAIVMFKKAILSAPFPLANENQINELSFTYASKSMAEFELKDFQSSLLSAENSLKFYETNEMLLHRIHCFMSLKRYPEALQLTDQLIQRAQNMHVITTDEVSLQNLIAIRNFVNKQISENTRYGRLEPDTQFMSYSKQNICQDSNQSNTGLWLHPSCELKITEKKGRHFLAKQFIPKDTIVLKERPINVVLHDNCQSKVCLNCHKWIDNDIWPCIGCDEVVFCDQNCFNEAYYQFHAYECGFVGLLVSYGHGFSHAYRIMTRVGVQRVHEIENKNTSVDFNSYIEYESQLKYNPLTDGSDIDSNDRKWLKLDTEYQGFCSMLHHNDKQSNVNRLYKAIEVALLFDYSKQFPFDIEEDLQMFVIFVDILMKNIHRVTINVFGWYEYVVDNYPERQRLQPFNNFKRPLERTQFGSSFCTVAALFNHSCEPNIFWFFENGIMKFKTTADINAGQEINNSYGPSIRYMSLADRHNKLKNFYFFGCNCSACLRECQSILCIGCRQCSGPVIFTEPYIFGKVLDTCCLQCGQVFEEPKYTMNAITKSSVLFNEMMKNLENNLEYDIQTSIETAKESLNQLIDLVYPKSKLLKEYIKQLARRLAYLGYSSTAIEYAQHLALRLESENEEPEDYLEDLICITDCYFIYLNNHQFVDTNHWSVCFRWYDKLIEVLEKQKQLLKQSPEKLGETQDIRLLLKAKKKELTILSKSYHSMGM